MDRLQGDLEALLRATGARDRPEGTDALVAAWPGVVGAATARSAWPARLAADGTLHVATASAVWAQELTLLAPEILKRLREAAPTAAPTGLRFAPGPLPALPPPPQEAPSPPAPSLEEEETAAAIAGAIADPELREAVRRAARVSLAARRENRRV
ncbi:MAG: DUF721 domain-containing protein [Thermoleophilia bacterium]|nr:DUF721 domain-containing protein [Thermoleophilia bacterium]